MRKEKIGILIGTNRYNSLTSEIANYYQKFFKDLGQETELIDLSKLPTDFVFSALYQNAGTHTDFNVFQEVIDAIQRFIFIVPEYNGSFPGVLKAFLDGLRYPDTFNGKKVALVGISAGVLGNAVGLGHLNDILSYMGANVLGLRVKLGLTNSFFVEGRFTSAAYETFIEKQIRQLIDF